MYIRKYVLSSIVYIYEYAYLLYVHAVHRVVYKNKINNTIINLYQVCNFKLNDI